MIALSPHEALRESIGAVFFGQVDDLTVESVLEQLDDRGYRVTPNRDAIRSGALFELCDQEAT